MKDLPNLDFMRSCAVLSVLVAHTMEAFRIYNVGWLDVIWIGRAGVFLFFVHTALVLMWSLERKPHTLDFYIRRAFRIYPLALLAALVTWAFHAPVVVMTATEFFKYVGPSGPVDWVTGLLLLSNVGRGHEYLFDAVMWSLVMEVDMYLLLPALFFFVSKNFSRWPILLLWVGSIVLSRPLLSGVNIFLVIPYFLPGVIAYVGFGRTGARLPFWTFPLFLAAVWLIFERWAGWSNANFLCLAVGLMLPLFHQMTAPWLIGISKTIAKYSYGIYLSHPFALVLGVYLMPHRALAVQLAVVIASVTLFSVAGYHLLEHPMIRIGSRLANRAQRRYDQHELKTSRIPEPGIDGPT